MVKKCSKRVYPLFWPVFQEDPGHPPHPVAEILKKVGKSPQLDHPPGGVPHFFSEIRRPHGSGARDLPRIVFLEGGYITPYSDSQKNRERSSKCGFQRLLVILIGWKTHLDRPSSLYMGCRPGTKRSVLPPVVTPRKFWSKSGRPLPNHSKCAHTTVWGVTF